MPWVAIVVRRALNGPSTERVGKTISRGGKRGDEGFLRLERTVWAERLARAHNLSDYSESDVLGRRKDTVY